MVILIQFLAVFLALSTALIHAAGIETPFRDLCQVPGEFEWKDNDFPNLPNDEEQTIYQYLSLNSQCAALTVNLYLVR